jgi:hypothetical protein
VSCQVSLHRKEDREKEHSDCLSFAKLDRLNRMNIVIRILRLSFILHCD